MEDDFLAHCMILFIKRELDEKINLDSIIDEYMFQIFIVNDLNN